MSHHDFQHLTEGNARIALVDDTASHSYGEVNSRIDRFATGLLGGRSDLEEERIAFFLPASLDYVTCMHGVWRAGGIAVPLNVASAVAELDHYLTSAKVTRMFAQAGAPEELRELCASLGIELLTVAEMLADAPGDLPEIDPGRRAMMLFTSGTTSKPKGTVSTHKTIRAQITTLIDAWCWTEDDVIPLFLPLHHIHGIVNILSCGLWAGATVHLFAGLDIPKVTSQVAAGVYNVFMAVPTVYVKLIQYLEKRDENEVAAVCAGFKAMRLNISGSAACPVKLFEQWQELTGQVLLERYGMTEIGMGISNPYHGERRAGYVGQPLPGVEVQLFDESHRPVEGEGNPGEIRIKGDNVFLEYWGNEEATRKSFVDGWFCTGDMAVIEDGYYRIMGRTSVDIIKSGGYKLSALEIEGVLLTHEEIAEVAVIGAEDEVWGEAVTAFVVTKSGGELDYAELKSWCNERMSSYKIPKHVKRLDALPRNAMGKVTKPSLKSIPL
ncbi:MAG: acyl-CoA synthetase [Gammaproteobacteria bacterium]|nr:acyl-CoA synthetase [Gammaproteobacteria bacterium]MCY3690159.1 acyl-CoA synthetase [Gammaproteobacteria bacterium]MDE0479109.1 acyl-CoA synthetase [Gammaproteobacteria bacterium]